MSGDESAGRWWRFEKYGIEDGWIRPTRRATLGEFDAWNAYWNQPEGRVTEPPHVQFVNLVRDLPHPTTEERSVDLDPEQERELLSWCSSNGLLGVLPDAVHQVTIAMPWKPADHESRVRSVQMLRDCDEWREWDVFDDVDGVETEKPADWPRSHVLIEPIGGGAHSRFQPLGKTWAKFFPDVPAQEVESYSYPTPLTKEFWLQYAEPVRDFILVGRYFAEAVIQLSGDPKDFRSEFGAMVTVPHARRTLNSLIRTTAPALAPERKGTYQRRWRSPSLLGMLAMMATQDLLGERHLYRCPCGRVISSSYPETKYCSPQHRDRYRKREQRRRKLGSVGKRSRRSQKKKTTKRR